MSTASIPVTRRDDGNLMSKGGGSAVFTIVVAVTLAELNASKIVIAPIPGKSVMIVGGRLRSTGAFGTLTSIQLREADDSPVIITWAQAQLTDAAVFNFRNTTSGQTIGAGFGVALTAGNGVEIASVGVADTATKVDLILDYVIV